MITANKILTKKDVEWAKKIIAERNYRVNYPHIDLWDKDDACVKWMSVLEMFESLQKSNLKVIDMGCGTGCTPHIISDMNNDVVAIDSYYDYHFCKNSNVNMIKSDIFDYLKNVENETYDVAIDVCAVTHFDTRYDSEIENYGWKKIADEAYRILKKNGRFIISSDCSISSSSGEFINPKTIIKLIESSGLKLDGYYRENSEDDFKVIGYLNVVSLSFVK